MLRIRCPFCGLRDHSEFAYVDDARVVYPALDASEKAWFDAVYRRQNPRGPAQEVWQHVHGCRAYLIVSRDTLTHEITDVRLAHEATAAALDAEDGA